MKQYDVIVIGGGTSGMMAAIRAATNGAKTLVIEKNEVVGKKLLATGGGRCNITNNRDVEDVIKHIPGNGRFLYSAFNIFNNYDIMAFFTKRGVLLKEEDHGRMFPVTDSSKTIVDALYKEMKKVGVKIAFNTTVKNIQYNKGKVIGVETEDDSIATDNVIVACGGRAAPETGSAGEGYKWARSAGHTITPLYPTEVPLISKEAFIKKSTLMGLSLREIRLAVLNGKNKEVVAHQMDALFTHFGLSGPAALRCAMFVHRVMNKENVEQVQMKLDVLPDTSIGELTQELLQRQKKDSGKSIKNIVKTIIPERYALFLLEQATINEQRTMQSLSSKEVEKIVSYIKDFRFYVHGTLPIEKAFVTGGGVSTKEVNPKTMESKLVKGLYFTGEILDINGYTGGFNITAALATGYVAGEAITTT